MGTPVHIQRYLLVLFIYRKIQPNIYIYARLLQNEDMTRANMATQSCAHTFMCRIAGAEEGQGGGLWTLDRLARATPTKPPQYRAEGHLRIIPISQATVPKSKLNYNPSEY